MTSGTRPPPGRVGSRGGCSTFPRSRTPSDALLSGIQGPVSPSGALGRCYSPPAVLCVPGHGHHPAYSPEDLHPVVGGSSGSGPCRVFSGGGGAPLVPPSIRRQVSFVDEVTMLGEEDSPECSPVFSPLILPVVVEEVFDVPESEALSSLILPVVEEFNSGAPVATRVDLVPCATGSGLPPPPWVLSICLAVKRWGDGR